MSKFKHKKVRITADKIHGTIFANLTKGSVHDIIQPPADWAKQYPNNVDAVWVEGNPGPVRVRLTGSNKEGELI